MHITLYHGTHAKEVIPTYGLGNDKHDYGRGFYLTESIKLAFSRLHEITAALMPVDYSDFNKNAISATLPQDVIQKIPLSFLKKAYPRLHDLEFDLAVQKVGEVS